MERRKRRNPSHAKALPGFEKGDDRVDDGFVINYYPIVTLICHSSPTAVSQKRRPPGASFECETYQYGGIEPQRIFFSENGNHSFLHDVYDVHAESRSLQQDVDLIMRPELVEFGVFPHAVRLVFGTPHRIDACILLGVGVPMLIKDRESVIRKQTPGCRPMKLT